MKIHSTYFWGKMLRSDALRNKIYLMSFNLTVVLSQLLNRGRHMYSCGSAAVYSTHVDVCSCCRCVYESSYSCWDLALKKQNSANPHTQHPGSIIHLSGEKNNIAPITSSSPVWEKPTGFGFLHPPQETHADGNLIIRSKKLNVYNLLTLSLCTVDATELC